MKFTDRKEFLYDAEIFRRSDTQTALGMHAEYVKRHSPNPTPRFFEVNRGEGESDPLWHMPMGERTRFSRTLDLPAINVFEKPDWRLTKLGIIPQRRDKFWLANLHLQAADYFPMRGDQVYWNGYRYTMLNVVLDPTSYWHQTGVWLGLVVECIVAPQGDARPVVDSSQAVPAEIGEA